MRIKTSVFACALAAIVAFSTVLPVRSLLAAPPRAADATGSAAPKAGLDPELAAKLTPQQKRDLNHLLGAFRRARKNPQKLSQVAGEAIGYGEPAISAVLQLVEQELQPALNQYRSKFYQQAVALGKRQRRAESQQEVAHLRNQVLSLAKDANLTKEMIVQHDDPAMQRLAELLLIPSVEVVTQSRELRLARENLGEQGMLWQRLAAAAYISSLPAGTKPEQLPTFLQRLEGEEELASVAAMTADADSRATLGANARLAAQLDAEEARTIAALNVTRLLLGLPALAIDVNLCAAARDHSRDMHRLGFFGHDSPVEGKTTPWDRAKLVGTTANAENIFNGLRDGKAANLGWFHSPGHHKNMLGDFKRVGVGRHESLFTEMFGR